MKSLLLLSVLLPLGALAQGFTGIGGFVRPIDRGLFDNCDQVKDRASQLASSISRPVYFMQLYPSDAKPLYSLFASDGSTEEKFRWVSLHDPQHHPYALFYFAHGAYSFRCRDNQDHYAEASATPPLASARGEYDPLLIQLSTGPATIWHFWATDTNMDTVYVVTGTPLEKLNGGEVFTKVKERLGARAMFLYVRNDPWFFGYVADSVPLIFTDSYRRITESEYRSTHTMVCYTDSGCKVVPSLYQEAWSR
jgi:hypothetical protein